MRRILSILPVLIATAAIAAVACGSSSDSSRGFSEKIESQASQAFATASSSAVGAPAFFQGDDDADFAFDQAEQAADQATFTEEAPSPASLPNTGGGDGEFGDGGANALQTAERRVIQNASITIQVENVRAATQSARGIAEALGGFVEQLSVSGDDDFSQGFIVIRVPQEEFFTAQERLAVLGELLGESVGSQDVTEQFVDLEARLRSLQTEEIRLLDLLGLADSVSEILIVENELTRIRSEIERLTGQRNFLERRVALATISVTFLPPQAVFTEAPSADYDITVDDVQAALDEIKSLTESLDGIVDRAVLDVRDDETSATITIRLPRADFDAGVSSIENLGDVRQKTLREGGDEIFPGLPESVVVRDPDEPDARVLIFLSGDGDGSDTALIAFLAGVFGTLGGIVLILAAYRYGRRHRDV